jgi:hypothetical protein
MSTESDHQPESWFHEIGSDDCPHGAEPDDDTPEWEAWYDVTSVRHTGSDQDVRICLDAPVGQACGVCSENDGEFVPWEACRLRDRARRDDIPAAEQPVPHRPATVHVGTADCYPGQVLAAVIERAVRLMAVRDGLLTAKTGRRRAATKVPSDAHSSPLAASGPVEAPRVLPDAPDGS